MNIYQVLITAFLLSVATGASPAYAQAPLERVVSLDYCADQFVLKLLPRTSILALSPDAEGDFSYMRKAAAGLPTVRPVAEDVLVMNPRVVVRSYGGGPHAVRFFEHAGVDVIQVPYANDVAGIRETIRTLAAALGVPQRGKQLVAEMDARLHRLVQPENPRRALYMTPTGVTTGPDTLVHEMLLTAGFENFQTLPGWRPLPLERLVYEQPDVVAAAFFDSEASETAHWSAMRHPVARRQIRDRPTASIHGAWTTCGGWFLLDAIESLAAIAAAGAAK